MDVNLSASQVQAAIITLVSAQVIMLVTVVANAVVAWRQRVHDADERDKQRNHDLERDRIRVENEESAAEARRHHEASEAAARREHDAKAADATRAHDRRLDSRRAYREAIARLIQATDIANFRSQAQMEITWARVALDEKPEESLSVNERAARKMKRAALKERHDVAIDEQWTANAERAYWAALVPMALRVRAEEVVKVGYEMVDAMGSRMFEIAAERRPGEVSGEERLKEIAARAAYEQARSEFIAAATAWLDENAEA